MGNTEATSLRRPKALLAIKARRCLVPERGESDVHLNELDGLFVTIDNEARLN